jgi:hypothetical protein
MHIQVDLVTDRDIWIRFSAIGEVVQREGYDAVRRVLKGDYAIGYLAGLHAVKDLCCSKSASQFSQKMEKR